MNTTNRAALLTKTFKVLKKHYKPVNVSTDRSILECLLYACCLENAKHEQADEVMAKLQQNFYDWNEVRVTTVAELTGVMTVLPDGTEAASRLKRSLHSVFECYYSFDLEFLKKQNLGKAIKEVEKFSGVTSYTAAFLTQAGLGGHAIPVNKAGFQIFVILGVISENEAAKGRVPGLERAIPKTKGFEFGSLFQQFAVDYRASPFSSRVRGILLEIAPDAKDRLPKRSTKKKAPARKASKSKASAESKKKAAKSRGSKPKKSSTKRLTRKKPR